MSDFGNPLLGQPPTDVKVTDVVDHEVDPRKRAQLEALGQKDAGWFNNLWASLWASILSGLGIVIKEYISVVDKIYAQVFELLQVAQGEKNSAFYDLAAAALEDLTGVEVDANALKKSTFGSGRLPGMQTLGGNLYNLLRDEFKPASGNLEASDTGPAERFLGFVLNWAIRQGNVESILEALPESWRVGEGAREYGELMAKNLGLGRLTRMALRPLMTTLVADPLQFQLNEQYRPKRLAKEQAIKRFFRDPRLEQQMRKEMAQEGFSDARIDDLIADARPLFSEKQIVELLFRFQNSTGGLPGNTVDATKNALAQRGYLPDETQQLIDLSRPILDRGEIGVLYANNKMDRETAMLHLSKIGYDDQTAGLCLDAHSISHFHAHHIPLAILRKAFHDAVIDLLEFKAKLTAQGYQPDDIDIIVLEMLQPTHGKVRQLSLQEIKSGYKAGALTEIAATQHLKLLNFSDADIGVILKTLTAAKPAKTPAPPTTPAA